VFPSPSFRVRYELIFPPDTQAEIRNWIEGRFESTDQRHLAWDKIEQELMKLASNPSLGVGALGGPFEKRPIYRFGITVKNVTHYIQVVYSVHESDRRVILLGFAGVRM
jgi:hypothetical protein